MRCDSTVDRLRWNFSAISVSEPLQFPFCREFIIAAYIYGGDDPIGIMLRTGSRDRIAVYPAS